MSKVIELSDEHFRILEHLATDCGQAPAEFLAGVIQRLGSTAYETEDWFRHLGASEEQIAEARRIAKLRSKAGNAHA